MREKVAVKISINFASGSGYLGRWEYIPGSNYSMWDWNDWIFWALLNLFGFSINSAYLYSLLGSKSGWKFSLHGMREAVIKILLTCWKKTQISQAVMFNASV